MSNDAFQNKESLKRYYAGQALIGLLSSQESGNLKPNDLAKDAFTIADAMVRVAWPTEKR